MRTRAYRRDKKQKRKNDVIAWLKQWDKHGQYSNPFWHNGWHRVSLPWEDGRVVGSWSGSPTTYSNSIDARHDFNGVTKQEASNMLEALDTIKEIGYNESIIRKRNTRCATDWDYT